MNRIKDAARRAWRAVIDDPGVREGAQLIIAAVITLAALAFKKRP